MASVRWTAQAADDLEAIVEFIAADSERHARLLARDIVKAVERLANFPQSGRMVPESDAPDIREILLGNYRIIYRARSDVIEVLTIYHGARLLNPRRLK